MRNEGQGMRDPACDAGEGPVGSGAAEPLRMVMEDKKPSDRERAKDGSEPATTAEPAKRNPFAQPEASGADEADDDEEDDEEEEEAPPPKKVIAAKPKPDAAKPMQKRPALPPAQLRSNEVTTGFATAVAGYLAFWGGWYAFSKSIGERNVNYFSHSAWLFLIAYTLVTISAFYFVRLEPASRALTGAKTAQVDRNGVLLAVLVGGPLYAVFWWVAAGVLKANYPSFWWLLELAAFAITTVGVVWGLRAPSPEDELADRMPTRRLSTLLMVPFMLVFGMIWLASSYPPWPQ